MSQSCPRCGRTNSGNQSFCSNCGIRLRPDSGAWKLVIAAFVIFAGVIWASALYFGSSPQQEETESPPPRSLYNANAAPLPTPSPSVKTDSARAKDKVTAKTSPSPARRPELEPEDEEARSSKSSTTADESDTYLNRDGQRVPRPRHSDTVPAGASARCRDGTYSFSRNRRGTCSHHGGVAQWL